MHLRRDIRITSRQLRMLVLLLLLLPLLPTGIMARFMLHTLQEDRLEAVASMTGGYRAQLRRVSAMVGAQIAEGAYGDADNAPAVAQAVLEDYEYVFAGARGIRIVDEIGRTLAESGEISATPGVSAELAGETLRWSVQLFGVDEQFGTEAARDESLRALVTPLAVAAAVFVVAALVAFAVTRQLRIEELKTDFLATVGHELKTPLASSRVLLETLADGHAGDGGARQDYYRLLLKENKRLGNLVEGFLTYERLVQRGAVLRDEEIDAAQLAEEAAAEMGPRAKELGGRVNVQVASAPGTLRGDREALFTVLTNLIDNALKYSEESPEVELRLRGGDGALTIEVLDRGIGIPPEAASRVFDPFYRVDERLSRSRGGCGLGLSIARHIVSAHGGEISAGARKGGGSCFTMKLPRRKGAGRK